MDRRRPQLALASAVGFLVLFVIVGNILIDTQRPDAVDREYTQRLDLLKGQLAENPGAKPLLVFGSSRMVMGFLPERVPTLEPADGEPSGLCVPFNFAHFGSGPIMNRLVIDRLERDGITPAWAILEIMPGFFPKENTRLVATLCTWDDVRFASGYFPFGELALEYGRRRTVNFPQFARRATRPVEPNVTYDRRGGYTLLRQSVSPVEREQELAGQKVHFAWVLRDWQPTEAADRALRDTIAHLQSRGTQVWLLLSPEGPDHQSLYGPGGIDRVTAYAEKVASETGVPLTDARGWLDEGDFADSHHMLQHGAEKFTDRLSREVVRPLLERGLPTGN